MEWLPASSAGARVVCAAPRRASLRLAALPLGGWRRRGPQAASDRVRRHLEPAVSMKVDERSFTMRRSIYARTILPILAIAGLSAVAPRTLLSQEDLDAKARAIHQRVLAIDSHVDVLLPTTPP